MIHFFIGLFICEITVNNNTQIKNGTNCAKLIVCMVLLASARRT